MSETQHDNLLFSVLKECQTLPVFLDRIFGFLHRRTDFYYVAPDRSSPIGLPEGFAEALVKKMYYKWVPKRKLGDGSIVYCEQEIPQAAFEEEVMADVTEKDETIEIVNDIDNISIEHSYNRPNESEHETGTNPDFTKSECYNGAVYDNYCWSQTINDVDITLKLPENVKARDLKVTILTHKVSVRKKGEILLEGNLCRKCKHSEAIWSLDKTKLQIHLDKCELMWWDCLVTSEEKLDITKMDRTRPYDELTEDAQAKIEQLTWDQERKRLGLPTSDDLANEETLRKAWYAEGSPFFGEFDPSRVTFS